MSYLVVLAVAIVGGLIVYIVGPYLYIQQLRYKQAKLVETNSCIVLTIDDGPGHRLTPAILDLLDEYKAHATFFVLGRSIPHKEHLLKDIAHRGHEIGTHSYDHLHSWKVSPIRAITDIQRGQREIARTLRTNGVLPFRPPSGKVNLFTLLFCLFKRMPICTWTLDSRDTWPAVELNSDIIDTKLHASDGAILLAHDFDRHNSSVEQYVLRTLRNTLEYAKRHSLRICTMTEAMAMPSPETSTPILSILYKCWHASPARFWERLKPSLAAKWSLSSPTSTSETAKFPPANASSIQTASGTSKPTNR